MHASAAPKVPFVLNTALHRGSESGLQKRELGVSFENFRVVGLGATATYQPTVASTINPLNVLEKIRALRHPALRDILSGFNGAVCPGEIQGTRHVERCALARLVSNSIF